jgi:hypothetical protein
MTDTTWSTYESIRSQSEYDTRNKIASELQEIIDRCLERGLNNHFISGLELAKGKVLRLTQEEYLGLDTNTLF